MTQRLDLPQGQADPLGTRLWTLLCGRMAIGAVILALYGLWVDVARLPTDLPEGLWWACVVSCLALFAGLGLGLGLVMGGISFLAGRVAPVRTRPVAAAAIETALVVPLIVWLALNEFLYTTTSFVLGPEALWALWATPAAILEMAWEMARGYLLILGALSVVCVAVVGPLSFRSFRSVYAPPPPPADVADDRGTRRKRGGLGRARPFARWVGSVSGALAVLATLLNWLLCAAPTDALTVLARSAPSLRALDLTRALVGGDFSGPAPETFGEPIISDAVYQSTLGSPRTPAPNVVLILMESTPANALRCYGHPRQDITPHIDALADAGVLFEHCVATSSFSTYSLVSLMTSLYMLRGKRNDHFIDTSFPFMGLPRALKLAGYELALFSSGNETHDRIATFYPPADFDTYFSHDTCGIAEATRSDCMRMDDRYAVTAFEKWIAERRDRRPFYCGFYLQSPHFNYEVPEPWRSRYGPTPPLYSNGDGIIRIPAPVVPLLRNQYDNAVRYADHWVGQIQAALERAGELDHSVIVVTGDHGEGFMEHGLARHGVHVWEEMVHVPLIVYLGSAVRASLPRDLPGRVPETVSHLDLAPTITGLVGVRPHPSWQGLDLFAPGYRGRDRPVFCVLQLANWMEVVYLNRFKYVQDLTDVRSYLFDLNTDPGERVNLADQKPELVSTMRRLLVAWHTRQIAYYAPPNRPPTHYIGRCEPAAQELDPSFHPREINQARPAARKRLGD